MTISKFKYPIGIQTFEKIREGGYMYADKTGYVYHLAQQFQFVFLSRPRRFGKSLLLSTMKSYFEGRRDLFEGLEADRETLRLYFADTKKQYTSRCWLHPSLVRELKEMLGEEAVVIK